MKTKTKQSGLSLMETTTTVAAAAMLTVFGLPAVRTFMDSMTTVDSAKTTISAALSSARAIAAKEQHYAGIRFQKAWSPKGPLGTSQYMIFIVHDFDKTNLTNGFRAADGSKPIKLPDNIGVMDLIIRINHGAGDLPARRPTKGKRNRNPSRN